MAKPPTYEMHPLTEVFPPLSPEQFADLKADIGANSLREPITVWRDRIIDGRHRYLACAELGIEPVFEYLEDDADPVAHVIRMNSPRAYLNTSQRAMAAARLSINSHPGRPPSRTAPECVVTIEQAAVIFSVSSRIVKDARKVIEYGDAELIHRCDLPASSPSNQRVAVSSAVQIVNSNLEREYAEMQARFQESAAQLSVSQEPTQPHNPPVLGLFQNWHQFRKSPVLAIFTKLRQFRISPVLDLFRKPRQNYKSAKHDQF